MTYYSDFGAYCLYLSINQHFYRKSYDYFKYNGKVTATPESFQKRNDKYAFDKLSKRYNKEDLLGLFVSNILEDKTYVMDFLDQEAYSCFRDYQGRHQSLTYNFGNELSKIFKIGPKKLFKTKKDGYPEIVLLFLQKRISPENMAILNNFIGFADKYDRFYGETDILWPKIGLKIRRYHPFLQYDKNEFSKILRSKLDEYK